MNLPNKLTIIRVCLIPFFVAALLFDHGNNYTMRIVANVLFIVASLTDLFDGKIARKYNLVTNFGKFMDPLADKLLVCSALICLIELGQLPAGLSSSSSAVNSSSSESVWWQRITVWSLQPATGANSRPPSRWRLSF